MKIRSKKFFLILSATAAALVLAFLSVLWRWNHAIQPIQETPIQTAVIHRAGKELWLIDKGTVDQDLGAGSVRLARLKNLRVEKIETQLQGNGKDRMVVRSKLLHDADLLIRHPAGLTDGQAVIPLEMDQEKLLRLTIQAGVAGLEARDLGQSLRFFSNNYHDSWGFNHNFIRELLKRAYREFDELKLELAADPEIRIRGNRAMVQARVRLTARYRGRTNYLLGGRDHYNTLVFQFENGTSGWKVTDLQGLRPLGFEERFFRLLGGDIGLPLTHAEREAKKEACMPCRDRMAERFGLYRQD